MSDETCGPEIRLRSYQNSVEVNSNSCKLLFRNLIDSNRILITRTRFLDTSPDSSLIQPNCFKREKSTSPPKMNKQTSLYSLRSTKCTQYHETHDACVLGVFLRSDKHSPSSFLFSSIHPRVLVRRPLNVIPANQKAPPRESINLAVFNSTAVGSARESSDSLGKLSEFSAIRSSEKPGRSRRIRGTKGRAHEQGVSALAMIPRKGVSPGAAGLAKVLSAGYHSGLAFRNERRIYSSGSMYSCFGRNGRFRGPACTPCVLAPRARSREILCGLRSSVHTKARLAVGRDLVAPS